MDKYMARLLLCHSNQVLFQCRRVSASREQYRANCLVSLRVQEWPFKLRIPLFLAYVKNSIDIKIGG